MATSAADEKELDCLEKKLETAWFALKRLSEDDHFMVICHILYVDSDLFFLFLKQCNTSKSTGCCDT